MEQKDLEKFHERFTTESNSVIKVEELLNTLSFFSNNEQNQMLIETLELSEKVNKDYKKANEEHEKFLTKRQAESVKKRKLKVTETKKIKPEQKEYINNTIKEHEEEINKIISLNLDDFQEYLYLIDKSNINYLILGLIKELNQYHSMADEAFLSKDSEMLEEIKVNTKALEAKISNLKDFREEKEIEEQEKCRIIFLEKSSGRAYFIEDIVDYEAQYASFSKLLNSLQNNSPIRAKSMTNHNSLAGLLETREPEEQTRIFYDKVNSNTYVVINAIIKKSDADKAYLNQLITRYKYYLSKKEQILMKLDSPDFLLRQEAFLREVEDMFKKKQPIKRKIKGGGGCNMLTLLEMIENRESYLKSIEIDNSDNEYLKGFSANVQDLMNKSLIDLVTVLHMVKNQKSYHEASNDINEISIFLEIYEEDLSSHEFYEFVNSIFVFSQHYKEELNNFEFNDFMDAKISGKGIKDIRKLLKSYNRQYTIKEINALLKWFCTEELCIILLLAADIKKIKETVENSDVEVIDYTFGAISSRKIKKEVNKSMKRNNNHFINVANKILEEELNKLNSYKLACQKKVSQKKKEINKQLRDLDSLRTQIKNNNVNLEDLKKYSIDDELMKLALIALIKQRNVEFAENYAINYSYQENPVSKMEKIFNDLGYNFHKLTEEEQQSLTSTFTEEKISENLNFLKTSSLSFISENDEAFVKVLTLDIDILMQLDSLLIRKKITPEFILQYSNLLNALNVKVLGYNINKLDAQKINFEALNNYNDRLIIDLNNKLLDMLIQYGIHLNSEKLKHFELLEEPNLLDIIDEFIELGLIKQIQTMPNLINASSKLVIKRILIMQLLDEQYINEYNTFEQTVRKGKDFYLSDEALNEYINQNYETYMDVDVLNILNAKDNDEILEELPDEIKFIEMYKKSSHIYLIGDKYFSRYKVLRCIKTLINQGYTNYQEILFQALIYNYPKHLTPEDILELKSINEEVAKKQLI